MDTETEIKNLKVEAPAKERLLDVMRTYKGKHGVSPSQSEALVIVCEYYLVNALESPLVNRSEAAEVAKVA